MSNERFAATLTGNDVAALLRSFDIEPRADSPFGSFEGIASDPAVRTSTNTEPFGEEWSSAISVLAAPSRQVRAIIPGPSETLIQVFYGSRSESDVGLVGCWLEDSGLRVTFPWSEDEVAAITARVVLSTPPPLADGREISLSVGGLEVMAASIDAMRDRLFASMSSRRPAIDHRFDQADVRRQLEMGAGSEDARWLVTLLRILSPSYLGVSSEAITAGSDELVAAGVITNDNGQWRPGQSMIDFATWWRSPLPAVAHEVIETVDGRMQRYDHRITIRGDGPLTQIDYRDLTSDAPSVTISSRDASDFIESLTELLAPAGGAPEWAYVLDPIEVRGLRDTSATVGSLLPGRWYLLLGTQGEWSRVADPDGPLDGWVPAGRVHVQSDAVNTVSSSADAQATGSEPPTSGPNTAASSGDQPGNRNRKQTMATNCAKCGQPILRGTTSCTACGADVVWTKPRPQAPPPLPAPPSSQAPMPTESRLVSRRAGSWLPAIAAFLVLVVAVGGWLVIADDGERLSYAPNEVYMVSAASAGAVFTPSLVAGLVGVDGGAPATTLATAPGMEVIPVKGSEELNYSGERGTVACDPSLLMEYLSVESSVAEVWAGAQGIDVGDVGRFVGSLTPMLLSQDVRVTEFVLAGDIAIPRQALLQYGTAVLVSSVGDPRVRCFSGNPLSVPAPVDAPIYIGTAWSGFSSSNVVEIEPCDEPLNQFVLLDLATGDAFVRSIGAAGGDDSDVVLSAPGTSTTTTLMSTTTSTALTTTSTSTTTTLPVADHNATVEGTVSASSQLCGSYAPAKAVDGDVTTSWISSSGDGGTSVFRWASPQDDFIGGITIVSNAANAKRATDHGFEAVTVSILDSAANVVFEERVDLPGTPDPDVVLHPNVVGQLIVLLLEGHENPKGSGFAELTVMVAR